jgi:hypothetical protein
MQRHGAGGHRKSVTAYEQPIRRADERALGVTCAAAKAHWLEARGQFHRALAAPLLIVPIVVGAFLGGAHVLPLFLPLLLLYPSVQAHKKLKAAKAQLALVSPPPVAALPEAKVVVRDHRHHPQA